MSMWAVYDMEFGRFYLYSDKSSAMLMARELCKDLDRYKQDFLNYDYGDSVFVLKVQSQSRKNKKGKRVIGKRRCGR